MYSVELASQPKRFLKKLKKPDRKRVIEKLRSLSEEPLPKGAIRVVGRKEKTYRIRVGTYRVLYTIFREENEILISFIDKRSRVYRD